MSEQEGAWAVVVDRYGGHYALVVTGSSAAAARWAARHSADTGDRTMVVWWSYGVTIDEAVERWIATS
jgi:hypothetical protein